MTRYYPDPRRLARPLPGERSSPESHRSLRSLAEYAADQPQARKGSAMSITDTIESLAAEILAEEAWFNALPLTARDDLGDRNFGQAQHKRAVALARLVQSAGVDR